jgi:hypothetical protein
LIVTDHGNAPLVISVEGLSFQEALLLRGLKIVLEDHGNWPFVTV